MRCGQAVPFAVALAVLLAGTGVASPMRARRAQAIRPAAFVSVIDNPYFPLTPGTTLVYDGETKDGFEQVEDYVTHDSKVILGVTCTVVRDRAWLDGELIEETFDWYAQDEEGSVWYFGEYVTEYENGLPVSHAGSWEAGVDGAVQGIIMPAHPRRGHAYRQEYSRGVAEDMARVIGLEKVVCVEYDWFEHVLVTMDWSRLEPGYIEHKLYAPGVGLILEVDLHGGQGSLELVDILME